MAEEKLAVIIPTKDRPDNLEQLLKSISSQEVRPIQIIIVDGGMISAQQVVDKFTRFHIDYLKAPCSLPIQRNAGIKALKDEVTVVAFFDDDIILCPKAIEAVMQSWSGFSGDICGIGCNNISHARPKVSFLEKFFLVGSDKTGIVLPSGFQSKLCSLDKDYQVQWLIGGATFWKRDIFKKYKFDEWYYGYAHCEDLDFSYLLSKEYKLLAIERARFRHNTKPIEKKYEYHLGKMQVINRVYFVKKYQEFSLILCYWSCLGLFLKNLFLGTFGCRPKYLVRGIGIFSGVLTSLFKNEQIKEKIKA